VRPLRRFCRARDDYDLCRELINLRGTRTVRFCDFAPDDFRDLVLFAPLARNDRLPPFRDLVRVLPIAAPVTAPTVCFGIGGTWISSDGRGLFLLFWL
jgi:hypothetical protein